MEPDGSQNGRICLYDNVRFVLITMVIIGHSLWPLKSAATVAGLNSFIYTFHMPAMLFLAGMFFKDERIIQKVLAYLCIHYLLKTFFFAGNLLVSEEGVFAIFFGNAAPWFVFVLALYTICGHVLRNIDKRFLLAFSILMGCLVGYDDYLNNFLYLSQAIVFYPFYLLGQMTDRQQLAQKTRRLPIRLAGGAILLVWPTVCVLKFDALRPLTPLYHGTDSYNNVQVPLILGPIYRILCYCLAIVLTLSLISVLPSRRIPIVTRGGGKTMQIYFWHQFATKSLSVIGLTAFLAAIPGGYWIWVLIQCCSSVVLSTPLFSFPTEFVLRFAGVRQGPLFRRKIKKSFPDYCTGP